MSKHEDARDMLAAMARKARAEFIEHALHRDLAAAQDYFMGVMVSAAQNRASEARLRIGGKGNLMDCRATYDCRRLAEDLVRVLRDGCLTVDVIDDEPGCVLALNVQWMP